MKYYIIGHFWGGKQLEWAGIDGWVESDGTLYDTYERAQTELNSVEKTEAFERADLGPFVEPLILKKQKGRDER